MQHKYNTRCKKIIPYFFKMRNQVDVGREANEDLKCEGLVSYEVKTPPLLRKGCSNTQLSFKFYMESYGFLSNIASASCSGPTWLKNLNFGLQIGKTDLLAWIIKSSIKKRA